MKLTSHILKLSGYHAINVHILILILHKIGIVCYYKTELLTIIP